MENKNSFLWLCLILSTILHIWILLFAPSLPLQALPETRYTEVMLVPAKVRPLQGPLIHPQEPPIKPEDLWAKGLELDVKGALEAARKPTIHLPETSSLSLPEPIIDLSKLTEKETTFLSQEVSLEPISSEERRLLEKIDIPGETESGLVIEEPWQIRGPASKRKVLFKPPPPSLKLKAIIEIELKFWVLPDGAIGKIIPIRRGDPTLEREMMAYLKEWRFNPLPPDVPQEEQWGTLPIKYRLQ